MKKSERIKTLIESHRRVLISAIQAEVSAKIRLVKKTEPDYRNWTPESLSLDHSPALVWEKIDDEFNVIVTGISADGTSLLLSESPETVKLEEVNDPLLLSVLEKLESITEVDQILELCEA